MARWPMGAAVAAALALWACASDAPAPYNLSASTGGGAAYLEWACGSCDSFVVDRSRDGPYSFEEIAKVAGERREYRDFNVDVGSTYYYRVAAWYEAEGKKSAYSPEVGIEVQ